MKYNIYGFNQKKLIEYGLDTIDAMLLRYFVDFKATGKMISKIIDGRTYYWIQYKKVIEEYPILGIKSECIYRRLKNMVKKSILQHKTVKIKGVYSFYNFGREFKYLVGYLKEENLEEEDQEFGDKHEELVEEHQESSEINSTPYGKKFGTHTDLNTEQIIPLLKDNSTKNINNIYESVIEYLNDNANTHYRPTTKKNQQLIKARVREGFKEQDFYKVIDNKVSQWLGTEMDKFLRPTTLFGTKFEGYLNEKGVEERYGEAYGKFKKPEKSKFGITV